LAAAAVAFSRSSAENGARVTTCFSGSRFGGLFVIRFQFGPTSLQLLYVAITPSTPQVFFARTDHYSPSSITTASAKVLINFAKRKAVKSF
jgi:hypothetical protein